MKRGGRLKTNTGFTIIEVLITLGVSASMFLMVAFLIAGKQSGAEFVQAIRNIETQIESTIGEVGNGYYPNNNNFSCNVSGNKVNLTTSASGQGTNQECVFLGKILDFGGPESNPGRNTSQYRIYSVAAVNNPLIGTLSAIKPIVMTATGASTYGNVQNGIDNSQAMDLNYGLRLYSMTYDAGSGPQPVKAIGFMQSLGTAGGSTGLESSSQHTNILAVFGSNTSNSSVAEAEAMNKSMQDPASDPNAAIVNPSRGFKLCFESADGKRSGLISIGGTGGNSTVTLTIKEGTTTCA